MSECLPRATPPLTVACIPFPNQMSTHSKSDYVVRIVLIRDTHGAAARGEGGLRDRSAPSPCPLTSARVAVAPGDAATQAECSGVWWLWHARFLCANEDVLLLAFVLSLVRHAF